MRWPKRQESRFLLLGAAGLVLALLCGYAVMAYGTRGAPPPVSLGVAPAMGSNLGLIEGKWGVKLGDNSFAGYRIRERLGIFPAPNDAVGRSQAITGALTIKDSRLLHASFTVDVTRMRSQLADRDDRMRSDGLATDSYPRATFVSTEPVDLTGVSPRAERRLVIPGDLTIHGTTNRVRFPIHARWNGATIDVAGSLAIDRSDYGLEIPGSVGLRVSEVGTIEVRLEFVRGAGDSLAEATPGPNKFVSDGPSQRPNQVPARFKPATGSELLVVMVRDRDGSGKMITVHSDGSARRALTHWAMGSNGGTDDRSPACSSSGVAYSHGEFDASSGNSEIRFIGFDGVKRKLARSAPQGDAAPAFGPDGISVAFIRTPGGLENQDETTIAIGTLATSGKSPSDISKRDGSLKDAPAWAPHGSEIVFTRFAPHGDSEDLFALKPDGSGLHALANGPHYEYDAAWSPEVERSPLVVMATSGS
jgi:polyisoprenoid-binding protein YceI